MTGPEPETGRPAGHGLCEPLTVRLVTGPLDDEDRWLLLHGDYDEGA